MCRARIAALQESPQTAFSFLEAQAAHFHTLGLDRPRAHMLSEQIKILLSMGDHHRAAELVAKLNALGTLYADATGALVEIPAIAASARAHLALIECDPHRALDELAKVQQFAKTYGRGRSLVKINLLAALAHDRLEQDIETRSCLSQALQLGSALGLRRTILDEWDDIGPMLSRVQDTFNLEPSIAQYLAELLIQPSPIELPQALPEGRGSNPERSKLDVQCATLTPREREILGLIAQAMSNKRIALALNISFGTVKWNVKNILAKLGVSSRYDAISLARQQGLIK
jgi:LuxR family maltose regulon positive regulatory protein